MPSARRATGSVEQFEAVGQAFGDLRHGEDLRFGGGELNGQRDALEALHDLSQGPGRRTLYGLGGGDACALKKELHGLGFPQCLKGQPFAGRGNTEGWDGIGDLARNTEELTAGGDKLHRSRPANDGGHEFGTGFSQMLAGVEDEQRDPTLEI